MNPEQLQFIFSLFSLIGVVGILFYLILEKTKSHKLKSSVEELEEELIILRDYLDHFETSKTQVSEVQSESAKDKIIALYEEGMDEMLIENQLNVPRATIDMVIKFHTMNKTDNWRKTVD